MSESDSVSLVLLCALPEEARPVVLRMEQRQDRTPAGAAQLEVTTGCLGGLPVLHVRCGEGATHAERAIEWLDERYPHVPLLAYGVAGAATGDLDLGDWVLAGSVEREKTSEPVLDVTGRFPVESFPGAPRLLGLARSAAFVTVERPAVSSSEKKRIKEQCRGSEATVCIEMESYPLAHACLLSGRSVLLLRVISDTSEEALPAFLARCRTPDGATDIRAVAFQAALRPWSWGPLLRLAGRVRRGGEQLASGLESVCSGSRPGA